jgi:cycloeucalenol cycloisomerase
MGLCVTLSLPFLLQPVVYPLPSETNLPLSARYSFKANVWIAIFSFIGNYWYTHYFYSVLKAKYTFPSWRLNDVPIPLFFATHFYFVFYHTMSNLLLRKIETRYFPSSARTLFFWLCVLAFSYFTAFMETLTISSFPDYSFEDRYMAYTVGSAFYAIYFIVSYPVFYRYVEAILPMHSLSSHPLPSLTLTIVCMSVCRFVSLDEKCSSTSPPHTLFQTCMEALGTSMLVLCLLDFCRLALDIPLNISGKLFYLFERVAVK